MRFNQHQKKSLSWVYVVFWKKTSTYEIVLNHFLDSLKGIAEPAAKNIRNSILAVLWASEHPRAISVFKPSTTHWFRCPVTQLSPQHQTQAPAFAIHCKRRLQCQRMKFKAASALIWSCLLTPAKKLSRKPARFKSWCSWVIMGTGWSESFSTSNFAAVPITHVCKYLKLLIPGTMGNNFSPLSFPPWIFISAEHSSCNTNHVIHAQEFCWGVGDKFKCHLKEKIYTSILHICNEHTATAAQWRSQMPLFSFPPVCLRLKSIWDLIRQHMVKRDREVNKYFPILK